MIENSKGTISIFLCIIMAAVYIFGGLLIDSARIKTAEGQIRKMIDISLDSVLAEYNDTLKTDYCLLALEDSNPELLEEVLNYYLNQNLVCDLRFQNKSLLNFTDYFNIYDYSIEDIDLETLYNLSENEVLENQIIEAVKYRIPQKFINHLDEYITELASIKNETDIIKDKLDLNIKYGEIFSLACKMYNTLYNNNETIFKNNSKEISNKIYENLKSIDNLKNQIKSIKKRISRLKHNDIVPSNTIKRLREKMARKRNKITQLQLEVEQLKRELETILDNHIIAISQVLEYSQDIQKLFKQCKTSKAQLNNKINKISSSPFKDSILKEINIFEKGLDIVTIIKIESYTRDNLELTKQMIELFKNENYLDIRTSSNEYLINTINSNFLKNNKSNKEYEALLYIEQTISNYFSNKIRNNNYKIKKELPSYRNIFGGYPNKIMSESININFEKEYMFSKEACKTLNNLELENGNSTYNIFDIKNHLLSNLIKNSCKGLFINEYILGMFKNSLSEMNKENDLLKRDITKRSSYFNQSEVEYIISGSLDEKSNRIMTERSISVIRFSLNFLHLYKDPKKNKIAMEIAMATGSSIAIPIIHTSILSIWAGMETKKDMDKLMEGETVPFIKMSKDWCTTLKECTSYNSKAITNNKSKKNNSLSRTTSYSNKLIEKLKNFNNFTYKDYLRILLMVKHKDIKLNRIQDIIQLNISKNNNGYKIYNSNTYIYSKNTISIKKLFPDFINNRNENRYSYSYILYKGY